MKVKIKVFDVDMDVKNNGIEFEVKSADGKKHLGDVVLNKTGLIWCKGRTTPAKGIKVKFEEFAKWAEEKAAAEAAKSKSARRKVK